MIKSLLFIFNQKLTICLRERKGNRKCTNADIIKEVSFIHGND